MATKKTTGKKLADMMYGGDQMRATPQSRITGPVANAVRKAQKFASQYEIDPRIPLLGGTGIDELLSLPEAASLMEDVSYNGMGALIRGGNAATGGIGTFRPDPRIASAADVALTTTGLGSLGVKAARAAPGALKAGARNLSTPRTLNPQAGVIALGGGKKAAKPAKENELALPPVLPRAPAKTKEEIRPYAQRMAQQMTGEFYRPNPKKSENVAGKSFSQFKMEKGLEHDIRPTKEVVEPEVADIEKQLGMLKIGISGDTTIADKVLRRAGPYELFDPSPQHGGPRYGLGGEGAWASNNPIAANVQKRVNELSEAYGAPPLGQYMAMGPQGSNFAQHFADANLQAIDISAMTKSQIEQINKLIREGSQKSGPRPSFPGIEDRGSAYLHFAIDPELRKHFNDLMQKTSVTEKLNLPDGRIILHAITEPELRDKEILNTGFSQMRLKSAFDPESLQISAHPTYSHVIPHEEGSAVTRTKYLTPGELEFSDVLDYAKQHYRPQDMTRVFQTSTPRQIVDPQHIDEMKMYEELMKEYTGKKAGGSVHFSDNPDVMQLEMAKGGLVRKGIKAIRGAAESAGQKAPVLAEKDLTTLQDAHTNLGDRVRAGAIDAQKMMEGFGYQYDKGQRVFTKDSAGKNKPPYTILNRTRVGNQVMREDHPEFGPGMGRPIIDPETGKAMRTPYEPGYRVRMERGPDDWSEFEIPEKAIVGDVEMASGGAVRKAAGGEITADDLILEERKL
jgi:hypothetical protein